MRLLPLLILAGGAASAADFTYLDGSLTGFAKWSNGTLTFSVGKSIQLKTRQRALAIPYVRITAAELGDVHTPAPDPIYKVWSLKKRFVNKGETQELTITFQDDAGGDQSVTVELSRENAVATLDAIRDRNQWWGDRVWRTRRNTEGWEGN
jgi:hypothetical protein